MTDASTAAFAEAVHRRRVIVVGGGVAGLVAALECAKVGIHVTLLEAADRLGGIVGEAVLADVALDLPVEGFAAHGDAVGALAGELGLGVETSRPLEAWIVAGAAAAPVARDGIAGIPANPWDAAVRRLIGWRGAWRAYLDRLRPPLTIGQERSLGRLVRVRMGERVRDRLVAPLSLGGYGIDPDDVDVEIAAPGLSTALTRTGSLAGGVAQVRGDDAEAATLARIEGGMARLVEALAARLAALDVDVRTGVPVVAIRQTDDGRWQVEVAEDADSTMVPDLVDAVVVAVPEVMARSILAASVPALDGDVEATAVTEVVTLVVDAPVLDRRPRGDAVFAVPGAHRATGAVVSTVRWPALAAALPSGRHVVRVAFGTQDAAPATAGLDDDAAIALAHVEAQALLGVALPLVAARRDAFDAPLPASALGHREAAHAVREAVGAVAGLGVTGAWLSGPGLAQVVPDAVAEADRVRSAVLWGSRTTAD